MTSAPANACSEHLGHALCACIALLLSCGQADALEPSLKISQYAHTAWTRQSAHMQGGVFALAQTLDGNLWVGTDFGLLSFDGVRFAPWQSPSGQKLSSESVRALASAPDGSLWIGTADGLSHWIGDRLEHYRTRQGPTGPAVAAILMDRTGMVWIGVVGNRTGGLCRVESKLLHCYGAAEGLPSSGILSLSEDRLGNLRAGGFGALFQWSPGGTRVYPLPDPLAMITSIVEDRRGQTWVAASRDGGLRRLDNGKLVPHQLPLAGEKIQPAALLSDRDGGLWIGTWGQGLVHLHDGQTDRFAHADGLSNDNVRVLFEDREGNVWAGTDGGLDRFHDLAVTTISKREGLSQDNVGSVSSSRDGGVWIGTHAGLNLVQDRKSRIYGKADGLLSTSITGVFEDRSGRLWVASSAGLAYSEQGRFRTLIVPSGQSKLRFMAAATEDREHALWFSDPEHGLVRVRNQSVVDIVPWPQFENKQAWALEADPTDGGIWLGFSQGGIAHYKPGTPARHYTLADGLPRSAVMDLHFTRDRTLWIATQAGLGRLRDGHIATLTIAGGLPCDRIHAMVEDDEGALWLYTPCGLIRIAAADLSGWSANPGSKIKLKLYDAADGMRTRPTPSGYFRRAAKSRDGRLWFAVFDGVAMVDPKHLFENRIPPPVQIQQVTADRKSYPVAPHLTLPPLTKELQIDYTAFSFVSPEEVRFRYRLDPFDKEWNDVGERRQAVYTNLPPGGYRFRVMACNNDGVWNETGASYDFAIQPAFYQTNWFRILSVAAFGTVVWSLYRLRLRQIAVRFRIRYEERLGERTRIARELHDTLIQNIAGFALQLDALSKTVTAPRPAKDRLRELREQAEQWLHEARLSVWDLRSPSLEGQNLLDALRKSGEQITSGRRVRFQVTVTGKRRPSPPSLEEHLLRIVQETIRNAVRHAQPNQIEVNVSYAEEGVIRVQIRDDGRGFDLEAASRKMGHWGIATMRERANQIGADLAISSQPGRGTEVEIVAPIVLVPR